MQIVWLNEVQDLQASFCVVLDFLVMAPRLGARQKYLAAQDGQQASSSSGHPRSRSPPRVPRPPDTDDASDDFAKYVKRLCLTNRLSGVEVQTLTSKATRAGGRGVSKVASSGNSGARPGNVARDILRQYVRESVQPEPYYAEIPCHNPSTKQNSLEELPFLLVHEMLAVICASGRGILKQLCSLSSPYEELRAGACASLEIDPSTCIAVGFHGDGVPHQKNQTIIVFSWNCISMPSAERFLFTAIPKRFCCACGCRGRHSLDAVANIFRWCMCILTIGLYPTVRHDRSPWTARDRIRAEKMVGISASMGYWCKHEAIGLGFASSSDSPVGLRIESAGGAEQIGQCTLSPILAQLPCGDLRGYHRQSFLQSKLHRASPSAHYSVVLLFSFHGSASTCYIAVT